MRLLLAILIALPGSLLAQGAAVEMERRLAALPSGAPGLVSSGDFHLTGNAGTAREVAVEGQAFRIAQQIRTTTRPATPYAFQYGAKIVRSVANGDSLLATFWARGVEMRVGSDEARTEFCFELARPPYTKSATFPVALTREWTKYYVPFTVNGELVAGTAQVLFRCGYDPQVIEIADITVVDYGGIDRSTLPYMPSTYSGREAGASWRSAAAERIEKLRKADMEICVVDAAGQKIPGAQVRVRQLRHAFGWGTAVDARQLLGTDPDSENYRSILLADFNKAVIENDLKWINWEKDREPGLKAVVWLKEHGISTRGHCLVWPGKMNLPQSIRDVLDGDPNAIKKAVESHIVDELSAMRGLCPEWDVVNEPFTNTDLQKILGDGILGDWFRIAASVDPSARLDINDYSILASGGRDTAHQDHYFNTIKSLLDVRAPLGGIGIQSHFSEDLTPIPRLGEILDRFATLGLPIQITELDINTIDEQLAADYMRDFLSMMFSHPSIGGVLVWGFWEKRHWIPNAAFYRADWSLRPAGEVWKTLTQKTWWTDQTLTADKDGRAQLRGFLGDYEITATGAGIAGVAHLTLPHSGSKTELIVR